MQQSITPASKSIVGVTRVPGSKSITNRALLLAALAKGESRLTGVLFSDDSEVMLNALTALGVSYQVNRETYEVIVQGCDGQFPNTKANIYCKDAGTATRFLMAACAAMPRGEYHFSASERMMERPSGPLLKALEAQGTEFTFKHKPYHMPFIMKPHALKGGEVEVNIELSSQFLSGLMMASPYAKTPLVLKAGDLSNKPYVHMTEKMMGDFGGGTYVGCDYAIEPDASTASYFFAMAALTQGKITLEGMSRTCMQGDIRFVNVLEKMGCIVTENAQGITVQGPAKLIGIDVDMAGFSDTFMTIVALAVFADKPMTLSSLAHTRLQESDRIAAMEQGLSRLGIKTESSQSTLTIYPGTPKGAVVSGFNDHRIAMSLALIGLRTPGVVIDGAECVKKTCPDYFERVEKIRS